MKMSYRNKTYVAFDGDNDMWAYGFMKGWHTLDSINFNFEDAHGIKELTNNAQDETYIKNVLRERLKNSKQFILLVGEYTKNLRKYVQWEIEIALNLDIPIIVTNLNKINGLDYSRCPVTLRNHLAVHIPFKLECIKHAMNDFTSNYNNYKRIYSIPIKYSQFDQ